MNWVFNENHHQPVEGPPKTDQELNSVPAFGQLTGRNQLEPGPRKFTPSTHHQLVESLRETVATNVGLEDTSNPTSEECLNIVPIGTMTTENLHRRPTTRIGGRSQRDRQGQHRTGGILQTYARKHKNIDPIGSMPTENLHPQPTTNWWRALERPSRRTRSKESFSFKSGKGTLTFTNRETQSIVYVQEFSKQVLWKFEC